MTNNKLSIIGVLAVSAPLLAMMTGCQRSLDEGSSEQHHRSERPNEPAFFNKIDDAGEITAIRKTSLVYQTPPKGKNRSETIACEIAAETKITFKELLRMMNAGEDKKVRNAVTNKTEYVAPVIVLSGGLIWAQGATIDSSNAVFDNTIKNPCKLVGEAFDIQLHPNFFSGFGEDQKVYNMPGRLQKLPQNEIR